MTLLPSLKHGTQNTKGICSNLKIWKLSDYLGVTGMTAKSGAGFYIHKDLNPPPRLDSDFKIFDNKEECESVWVEIVNKQSPNIIAGVIYRHPSDRDDLFLENLKRNWIQTKKRKK